MNIKPQELAKKWFKVTRDMVRDGRDGEFATTRPIEILLHQSAEMIDNMSLDETKFFLFMLVTQQDPKDVDLVFTEGEAKLVRGYAENVKKQFS